MSAYYYFMATLPGLRWGEAPPIRSDAVLAAAREWLSAADSAALAAAAAHDVRVTSHGAGLRWWQWETALGNALAAARAARLGRDAAPYLRGTEVAEGYVRAAVQEAVKLDDALKAEMIVDQLRWQFYETLSAAHSFDFEAALSYVLRLGLLERWAQFDDARGRQVFLQNVDAAGQHETTNRSEAA